MTNLMPWTQKASGAFESLRDEMTQLYRRFFGESAAGTSHELARPWTPNIDIEESDKEFVIKADLPGVDARDVDISVSAGALILRGEKAAQHEEKQKKFHRLERWEGQFYREIPLPAGTDPDQAMATCTRGVITITVPKKPEIQTKKIPVQPQG